VTSDEPTGDRAAFQPGSVSPRMTPWASAVCPPCSETGVYPARTRSAAHWCSGRERPHGPSWPRWRSGGRSPRSRSRVAAWAPGWPGRWLTRATGASRNDTSRCPDTPGGGRGAGAGAGLAWPGLAWPGLGECDVSRWRLRAVVLVTAITLSGGHRCRAHAHRPRRAAVARPDRAAVVPDRVRAPARAHHGDGSVGCAGTGFAGGPRRPHGIGFVDTRWARGEYRQLQWGRRQGGSDPKSEGRRFDPPLATTPAAGQTASDLRLCRSWLCARDVGVAPEGPPDAPISREMLHEMLHGSPI
jgi:hypothetical protein